MRIVLLSRIWSSVPASASPANSAPLASANAPSVFDIEPMVSPPACPSRMGVAHASMVGKQSAIPAVVTTGIPRSFRPLSFRRSTHGPCQIPPDLTRGRYRPHFHPGQRLPEVEDLLRPAVRVFGRRDLGRVYHHHRLDPWPHPLLDPTRPGHHALP